MSRSTYQPITDEELERLEHETQERDKTEPRLKTARYDRKTGRLMLEMQGGARVSVPARSLSALADASDEELADLRIVSRGSALHWKSLDVQMTTIALLQLIFRVRTISDVTRRAGSVTSPAKTAAARENGKKGGRPRKVA
ncbi:MAG: DUF2442 domain-containing protein [Armatimonadota bacterium]|nr:DUF2442 domain-containing protein [Armatimonadota bacterium]